MAGGAVGDAEQVDRGERQQPERFDQHAALRVDRDFFADQAIEGEAQRQAERNQRQRAEAPELHQHADRRQQYRQPLQAAKALAQKQHAEHHVDQRVDKIAEARFQHMLVIHRPDKQQPVAADGKSRHRQQQHFLRLTQHQLRLNPAAAQADQQHHKQRRPDHAVGHDFAGRNLFDQLEVGGRDAPDKISAKRIKNALAGLLRIHNVLNIRKVADFRTLCQG